VRGAIKLEGGQPPWPRGPSLSGRARACGDGPCRLTASYQPHPGRPGAGRDGGRLGHDRADAKAVADARGLRHGDRGGGRSRSGPAHSARAVRDPPLGGAAPSAAATARVGWLEGQSAWARGCRNSSSGTAILGPAERRGCRVCQEVGQAAPFRVPRAGLREQPKGAQGTPSDHRQLRFGQLRFWLAEAPSGAAGRG